MTSLHGSTPPPHSNASTDALDRVVQQSVQVRDGSTTRPLPSTTRPVDPVFLPASTWQGSKPGYYFGTTKEHGTGYHLDPVNRKQPPTARQTDEGETSPSKKRKRGVQIAEDMNQTRVIIPTGKDLLEQAEKEQQQQQIKVLDLTRNGVQAAVKQLQKAVAANSLKRAQHADAPHLFMDSEVALYEHLAVCKAIAAEPKLYPELSASKTNSEDGVRSTLLQLLAHENPDVAAAVVALLWEWLETYQNEQGNMIHEVIQLAGHLVQEDTDTGSSLLDLLVGNLGRLSSNEDEEDEVGKGSQDVLSILESLVEMDLAVELSGQDSLRLLGGVSVARKLCQETSLLSWLLQQLETSDNAIASSQQGRCLEVLALLAPREEVHSILPDWSKLPTYQSIFDEESNTKPGKELATLDGVEALLQFLACYRKKQPETPEEVEALENASLVLSGALTYSPLNLEAFMTAQGIELVLRFLKERVHAGGAALLLLDFNGSAPIHRKASEHLVEAGGLKYLLPLFMDRNLPRPAPVLGKKAKKDWLQTKVEATTVRILYALTRHLQDDSPEDAKARLLAKFVQDELKCDRLVELLLAYDARARAAEYKFFLNAEEDEEEDEAKLQLAALDAKLAGGGDVFHRLVAVAAFVCAGSKRSHARIYEQLRQQQSGMGLIRQGLEEFASVLEPSSQQDRQIQAYLKLHRQLDEEGDGSTTV